MWLAQGLFDGCITPSSCILLNCAAISCHAAKGTLRATCLMGVDSPVSILNSTRLVSPHSLSSSENVL